MREAATTVREAGFEPWLATATAEKHAAIAALSRAGVFQGVKDEDWRDYADRVLAAQSAARTKSA